MTEDGRQKIEKPVIDRACAVAKPAFDGSALKKQGHFSRAGICKQATSTAVKILEKNHHAVVPCGFACAD